MQQPTETVGFRLSPQQEHLLTVAGVVGTVQCAALLAGPPRATELRDALSAAAARHEILRTTFVRPAGMRVPQQSVVEDLAPLWTTGEPGHGWLGDQASAATVLAREAEVGFDLQHGPLLRVSLHEAGDRRGLLVLTASAACADPFSLLLLVEELCRRPGDGAEPVQYADYAEWRHELINDDAAEAEHGRTFWREDAAQRPEAPRILFGSDTPSASGARNAVGVDLSAVSPERLQHAAARTGVSAPVFLEAAWHALLVRVSGATELVTAGWLDGRAQPDLARAVGPYAQPAPIRSRVQDGTSFPEVLDQVRRSRTTAARWQDCAAAPDLAALTAQAALGFAHRPVDVLAAPVSEIVALDPPWAPLPLMLATRASATSMQAEVRHDPAAFDARDAQELARRYAILLASAVADPERPVRRLAILDGPERARLIAASGHRPARSPEHAPPSFMPVHRQFEAQAKRTPDQLAVAGPGAGMSYTELNEAANCLAHYLQGTGAVGGAPIGLCMERTPSMLVALLAILKTGGPYVPLNFDHPPARLAHQLAQSGARGLVTEAHLVDRLPAFDGALVCVDRDAEAISQCPATNPDHPIDPEHLVYVMYTSGSTGAPKGVAITHGNLSSYASALLGQLTDDETAAPVGWRFGVVSAISTDLGNTSIFPPLVSGGCVQLITAASSMDGDSVAAELGDQRLDVLKITPSHLRALLAGGSTAFLPRQWLVLGGEALTWDLVELVGGRSPSCRILNHYGPTETTVGCCTYPVDSRRRGDALTVPIGFPLAGARAHVLDAELEPLPAGVPGELCIAGCSVARGYVGAPRDGGGRFVPDPFAEAAGERMYRTGDLARRLRDGALEFLGRLDEQVKIRGFRVELGEIEAKLARHPATRQVAVSAEDDHHGGLRLVAYIVTPQIPPVEELEDFLRQDLPDYMIPSAFATVEALPYTPSGKIDRRGLAALAEVQTRRQAEYVAPRDDTEQEIADIWCELLGLDRVGVLDDFFALGGHSLLATQAIMRIRRLHGDIPLRALLAAPTIASLAAVVRGATDDRR